MKMPCNTSTIDFMMQTDKAGKLKTMRMYKNYFIISLLQCNTTDTSRFKLIGYRSIEVRVNGLAFTVKQLSFEQIISHPTFFFFSLSLSLCDQLRLSTLPGEVNSFYINCRLLT